jgi:hypothetical protein
LHGGVAVINVGAATEVEMKEKKARVEDASTQLALQLKKVSFLAVVQHFFVLLSFLLPLKVQHLNNKLVSTSLNVQSKNHFVRSLLTQVSKVLSLWIK